MSYHPLSTPLLFIKVTGEMDPISADFGQWGFHTLDWAPATLLNVECHMNKPRKP